MSTAPRLRPPPGLAPPRSTPGGGSAGNSAAGTGTEGGAEMNVELQGSMRWKPPSRTRPASLRSVPTDPKVGRDKRRRAGNWPSASEIASRLWVLQRAAVFYALPDSALRSLARRLRPVKIARGGLIAAQDDPGDSIFFIAEGRCQLAIERAPGHRTTVAAGH